MHIGPLQKVLNMNIKKNLFFEKTTISKLYQKRCKTNLVKNLLHFARVVGNLALLDELLQLEDEGGGQLGEPNL
jgi:hypothetical protein